MTLTLAILLRFISSKDPGLFHFFEVGFIVLFVQLMFAYQLLEVLLLQVKELDLLVQLADLHAQG